jgi:hypothetical protein
MPVRGVIWLLVMAGLLLSGCSQVVGGHPGPAADTYGVAVSEHGRADVRVSSLIRQVDPCGFIDRSALAQFGRVVQLGPSADLAECQVGIERAGAGARGSGTVYPAQLSVDISSGLTDPGPPTMIDGVTVVHGTGGEHCDYTVELHLPGESEPGHVTILPSWFGGDRDRGADPADCAASMTAVRSVIAADNSGQLPSRSDSAVKVPLAGTDPCSLIAHLPAGLSVPAGGWEPTVDPYSCEFHVQGSSSDLIDVSFTVEPAGTDDTPSRRSSGSQCQTRFPAGHFDGNLPGSGLRDQVLRSFARVTVMVEIDSGCNDQALATAAKQLFGD